MPAAASGASRVLVVGPRLIRWGLERLVQSGSPPCEVLEGAAQLSDSIPALERQSADVVIDASEHASSEELRAFCARGLARIILVTGSSNLAWLDSAVMAGARGIVRTEDAPESLINAIEKVNKGELWIERAATSRIFMEMARRKAEERHDPERSKIASLTWRERQTVAAIVNDASAPGKVIAARLCISEHTLRNHLSSIYSKLDLSNRLDLYAYATRHGLHQHDSGPSAGRPAVACAPGAFREPPR